MDTQIQYHKDNPHAHLDKVEALMGGEMVIPYREFKHRLAQSWEQGYQKAIQDSKS